MIQPQLKAPFPYFGGKSTVAADVWARFGDVSNYIEPFFGSGAVLLGRPTKPKTEVVNDADNFIANFWRAVQADPEAVANWMDWPCNESDLHARHYWLVTEGADRLSRLQGDPLGYDTQAAGWWVWGMANFIGGGWCAGNGPWYWQDGEWMQQIWNKRRIGIYRSRPTVNNQGINACSIKQQMKLLNSIATRLRNAKILCGDWSRCVASDAITTKNGISGIFLDPPYADTAGRDGCIYSVDSSSIAHGVRKWCIENGENPLMRICLCGYDGEHTMPDNWEVVSWKTGGGFGNIGNGKGIENRNKERLWFSPHCLKDKRGLIW